MISSDFIRESVIPIERDFGASEMLHSVPSFFWRRLILVVRLMAPPLRLALALASAVSVGAEADCLAPGEFDTTFNFEGKATSINNLGGWADPDAEQKTVFVNVGVAGSDTAYPNRSFNLVLTNTTWYVPWDFANTRILGQFAQVNVYGHSAYANGDFEVGFRFCAELADGTPLTLGTFPLTFYDLCAASPSTALSQPRTNRVPRLCPVAVTESQPPTTRPKRLALSDSA